MKVIIGLGNPGEEYADTRHNYGFMALDRLARERGLVFAENKRLKALLAKDADLILAKPLTYMNNSGQAAAAIMDYYKLWPGGRHLFRPKKADLSEILTVVHDDLDIAFGTWRESIDSRSAGQKGVQSIIDHLHTQNFRRWRLGIASESRPAQMPAEKYVLARFGAAEVSVVGQLLEEIVRQADD